MQEVTKGRQALRVPVDAMKSQWDPGELPDAPRASGGLFELVNPVARRALELGLAAREPSFHVFVAAEPQVVIEDDIVRYAARHAVGRPPPPDIVYVHDFEHPEAPRPIMLPAGLGPALVGAMDALIGKLQAEIPSIAEADEVKKAQVSLASELEAKNKQVIGDLESMAKTLGFGVRSVQGGVQTFPILHGKPVSPEQFDVLDESTKKALSDAEGRLTKEVEKAARLVRAQTAKSEAKRNEAFSQAAEILVSAAMDQLREAFSQLWASGPGAADGAAPARPSVPPSSLTGRAPSSSGADLFSYFERVQKALVDDWEDLVEPRAATKTRARKTAPRTPPTTPSTPRA